MYKETFPIWKLSPNRLSIGFSQIKWNKTQIARNVAVATKICQTRSANWPKTCLDWSGGWHTVSGKYTENQSSFLCTASRHSPGAHGARYACIQSRPCWHTASVKVVRPACFRWPVYIAESGTTSSSCMVRNPRNTWMRIIRVIVNNALGCLMFATAVRATSHLHTQAKSRINATTIHEGHATTTH